MAPTFQAAAVYATGSSPETVIAADNLYGTTQEGGAAGVGVVYELAATGQESPLYTSTGGADGAVPNAGVIRDSAGNLYGTATQGGTSNWGVVYKLDAAGQETVLYTFTGGADGGFPTVGVVPDSAGNLYGTAYASHRREFIWDNLCRRRLRR